MADRVHCLYMEPHSAHEWTQAAQTWEGEGGVATFLCPGWDVATTRPVQTVEPDVLTTAKMEAARDNG